MSGTATKGQRVPKENRCIEFLTYPQDQLDQVELLVKGEARGVVADRGKLEEDLLGALYNAGVAHDGSDQMAWFMEFMAARPTPQQLALGFRAMASARNPLDPSVCTSALQPLLGAAIGHRFPTWRSKRGDTKSILARIVWDELSEVDQVTIRSIVRDLERNLMNQAPRHRLPNQTVNTLLDRLAAVFIEHTGFPYGQDQLSASQNSAFVQFVAAAVKGFDVGKHHMSADKIARRLRANRRERPFRIPQRELNRFWRKKRRQSPVKQQI
jgi:hypothetical protein